MASNGRTSKMPLPSPCKPFTCRRRSLKPRADDGSKAQHFAPWLPKHAGEFNAEHRSSPGITCHHWPRSSAGLPRHASRLGSRRNRSEEHTSELQSLMRLSYADFCLNKKNNSKTKSP